MITSLLSSSQENSHKFEVTLEGKTYQVTIWTNEKGKFSDNMIFLGEEILEDDQIETQILEHLDKNWENLTNPPAPKKPGLEITTLGTVGECNTADITFEDTKILEKESCPFVSFRNEYGFIIRPNPTTDKTTFEENLKELRKAGLSEKFIEIYTAAHQQGFHYLAIDCDATHAREEEDPSWENPTAKPNLS